jgi:hypothetical protein
MATVETQHRDYEKMLAKWQRCRDCVSGQDAIHDAGETYLPRLTDQTDDDYKAYKNRAQFYNCFWRTVAALSGMMFRKNPVVECSDNIAEMLEDVNLSNITFNVFAYQVAIEIMTTGRVGVLIDYPNQQVQGMTLAEASRLNLRPTMQQYRAETIINWRVKRINNVNKLVLLVLKEDLVTIEGDGFIEKYETVYRVLDLVEDNKYRVRLYRVNDKKENEQIGDDIYPMMDGKNIDFIPFIFIGIDDTTPPVDEPPLIDLADVNIAHYRLDADHKHGLHFTGLPTPVISGYTPPEGSSDLYIGSTAAWVFPDSNAKASYLEFAGQGLAAIKEEKESLVGQMAILGARLLTSEKKTTETAQTAQIHRAGESSVLSAIAHTISSGLTWALNVFSKWGGSDDECSVTLNQEFMPPEVAPQELTAWLQAWQQGAPGFSDQGFFNLLQKRELIASGTTLEEEQERIGSKEPRLIGE